MKHRISFRGAVVCLAAFSAIPAIAQISGAIQTTFQSGTTVNGNLYPSKDQVYLTGGPQNTHSSGLSPTGPTATSPYAIPYYFVVTDPSGATVLSQDPIQCRVVMVYNGVMVGAPSNDPTSQAFDPTYTADLSACTSAGGSGFHIDGSYNPSNGETPLELCGPTGCPTGQLPASPSPLSYYDTPNNGGEYKVTVSTDPTFPNGDTKSDNFKVRAPGVTYITTCKFIDVNGDGTFEGNDYMVAGWPFTATVNGSTILNQSTGQDGCTTFQLTIAKGSMDSVVLDENLPAPASGYTQVAPGGCTGFDNGGDAKVSCTVNSGAGVNNGNTVMLTGINPGDALIAPLFGNALVGSATVGLTVSKTAVGGNTFNWSITKGATTLQQDSNNGTAQFSYSVNVSHDAGTGWVVTGNISVTNPNSSGGTDGNGAIDSVSVTDNLDTTSAGAPYNGTCNVNGTGTNTYSIGTLNGGATVTVPYMCTFAQNPGSGTNTVIVAVDPAYGGPFSNFAGFDFSAANTTATVIDSVVGNLGTVTINSDNSTTCTAATTGFTGDSSTLQCSAPTTLAGTTTVTFSYSKTFSGDTAGTCTTHPNTASFTTNTNSTATNSNTVTVYQCVSKDLTVIKTATATFTAGLNKSVNQTTVQQSGGSITFNYTVSLTNPTFGVTGGITVSNPNNWESVTVNVADSIDSGGTCTISSVAINGGGSSPSNGSGVTIPASGYAVFAYGCTYSGNPTLVTGTNRASATVTATVDTGLSDPNKGKAGIYPPDNPVNSGTTGAYTFNTLTITDSVQSSTYPTGCSATLGTVSATTTTASASPGCGLLNLKSTAWGIFTYSITDTNSAPGTCTSYNNTAAITGGSSSNQVTVTVCNTNTGALTMGFWKNTNGAKIITSYCGTTSSTTSLWAFLTQFDPFKDDTTAAYSTCAKEATYVANVIGGATCSSGGTCNTMLRAQMLATALDVYFSTTSLGGNKIGAYNGLGASTPALGGVAINLSHTCSMADGSSGSTCTGTYEDARPEFGITTTTPPGCLGTTVSQMLGYANFPSLVNGNPVATANTGASWYQQNKGKQVPAKDSFDAINNVIANITTSSCSPSY